MFLLPLSGRGPLQTTMAVINAAKRISEAGTKLDKLARQIADQCPESSTKKDLLAYLQRIALYCHQLNITSKVRTLSIAKIWPFARFCVCYRYGEVNHIGFLYCRSRLTSRTCPASSSCPDWTPPPR